MQSVQQILTSVERYANTLTGPEPSANLITAWQRSLTDDKNEAILGALPDKLRAVKAACSTSIGLLDKKVMPPGDLEAVMLKGQPFQNLLDGFEEGQRKVFAGKQMDGIHTMMSVVGALKELQNFFGHY